MHLLLNQDRYSIVFDTQEEAEKIVGILTVLGENESAEDYELRDFIQAREPVKINRKERLENEDTKTDG